MRDGLKKQFPISWLEEEPAWQVPELALDEERILVLDADDPFPPDEWPVYAANDR